MLTLTELQKINIVGTHHKISTTDQSSSLGEFMVSYLALAETVSHVHPWYLVLYSNLTLLDRHT